MFLQSLDDRHVWRAFRGHSRTFSLAALLLPAGVRMHVANVYLLCRQIDTIADDLVLEVGPEAAAYELDDLEAALDDLIDGRIRPGWIWQRLAATHRQYGLRVGPIKELIRGARWDLDGRPIRTSDELIEYSELVGGTIGEIMLPFLVEDPSDVESLTDEARTLGVAMQLTNILRDVGEDWSIRRRIYLPLTDLAAFGIDIEYMATSGRPTEGYVDLLENVMDAADERYDAASPAIASLHPRTRMAIRGAIRMYREIMNEVRANRYDNLSTRAYVPWRRKLAVIARDRYHQRREGLRQNAAVTER